MENLAIQILRENVKEIQNLINYYEEIKDLPNVNIYYSIARKFMVIDIDKQDEHQQHLGI